MMMKIMMVMRCWNVIHSTVIIHAATTSLNVSKKNYSLVFYYQLHYHMCPTDGGFSGSFEDFEARASWLGF